MAVDVLSSDGEGQGERASAARAAITRRDLVVGAFAAAALGSPACRPRTSGVVRIGYMTNLTHAPAILGVVSGRIASALGVAVESRTFRAGPRVIEALVGDAIDVGVSGPAPVIYTHARHGAGTLRVLSGCCSGGASFVVGRSSGIKGPEDLRGKTLATVQIGTTQDIALRKYLRGHGYEPAERGGDVTVHALDAATILTEVRRGVLDGAWLPEPWATRVILDAGAVRFIDERDLWPNRQFPTAIVVARGDFVRARGEMASRVAAAFAAEVERAKALPDETREQARLELGRLLGKALPRPLIDEAARWVDFTKDPLADALETFARDAADLGLAPPTSTRTLFG
ncbi:MAG TPA: ABC transporter substrate-binding protein [Polyangiaceae bacterium]|jgi:NitT/TauT family transport system substrate-binding protein|nr:ABC transporter substrate-binding protein [Polyangiaceae bacterium]